MNVLIIDDEKIIRDAVSQLVEDAGHDAQTASMGMTALSALKNTSFDLVLLDVNLDRENGLDLLLNIQQQNPGISVVIFSAAATASVKQEAMRRGALDFLEKPFSVEKLSDVLSHVQKIAHLA